MVELLETQEMLNFCAEHNITADIELINVEQINEAFERLSEGLLPEEKGDLPTGQAGVKYRFVIDMGSLKR